MQHVTLDGAGIATAPNALRYCWPAELDLIAQLAGLRLRERYGGSNRTPFEASGHSRISVYGPTPATEHDRPDPQRR
jgi:hypothetical protein